MLRKFKKGSSSGMPILAIVGVVATLAGIGVIFQVIGNVGTQTGEDHDRRNLVDLGASIENKCTDVSTEDNPSTVPITVEFVLKSDTTLKSTEADDDQYISQLYLDFSDSNRYYDLPSDTCNIEFLNESDNIGPGQYQGTVSHVSTQGDTPEIEVVLN